MHVAAADTGPNAAGPVGVNHRLEPINHFFLLPLNTCPDRSEKDFLVEIEHGHVPLSFPDQR